MCSKRVVGSTWQPTNRLQSVLVLPVLAWASSKRSGFLGQPTTIVYLTNLLKCQTDNCNRHQKVIVLIQFKRNSFPPSIVFIFVQFSHHHLSSTVPALYNSFIHIPSNASEDIKTFRLSDYAISQNSFCVLYYLL